MIDMNFEVNFRHGFVSWKNRRNFLSQRGHPHFLCMALFYHSRLWRPGSDDFISQPDQFSFSCPFQSTVMAFQSNCLGERLHLRSSGHRQPSVSSLPSHTLPANSANRCPASCGMSTCRRQNHYQLLQNCIFTCLCGACSYLGGNYSEYCLEAVCHQN